MKRVLSGFLIAALLVPGLPASAKDRNKYSGPYTITLDQAVAIAREHGMVEVWETERDDGLWEIEGTDASGAKLEIELSGQTGEIVKIETYGAGRSSHQGSDDSGHHSGDHH